MNYANLLLPHPIIRPDGFDYNHECGFNMSIKSATCTTDTIQLELSYKLQSDTLNDMIEEKEAKIFIIIKCAKTNQRVVFDSAKTYMKLNLQLADYAGKLNMVPYVATSKEIHNFKSEEHVDEIHKLMPNGMDLPTGAILAIGNQHEITIDSLENIQAAIHMVPKDSVKEGVYSIDTSGDRIAIVMNPKTFDGVRRLYAKAVPVLYASLYVTAIEHAIRDLEDELNTPWAEALRKTLKKQY